MLIKARLTSFSLPLVHPLKTGHGTLYSREGIFVEIEDSCNLKGYGEATPIDGFSTESLQEARDALYQFLPVLLQGEKRSIERTVAECRSLFPSARAALSAIDTALCDLLAKQRGCSVATLLANHFQTDVSNSVKVNSLLHSQDIKSLISEAGDRYREGFRTFKIKVGVQSIDKDIERIGALRSSLKKDAAIRLDANGAWSPEEAGVVLQAIQTLSIEYLEQPLAADDLRSVAALRNRYDTPLAADEAACSAEDIQAILDHRAADIIVLKPAAAGGPHLSMQMGKIAEQLSVPCVTTTLMDGAVGRAMATHVAAALPSGGLSYACGLATGGLLARDLSEGLQVCDGYISIDDIRGLGIAVTPDQLESVAAGKTVEFLA